MSQLADLENAIVALLAAIQVGGQDVFATVQGTSNADDAALAAELRRQRKPAAVVALDGRRAAAGDDPVPESPRFTIAIAEESLRGSGEARLGGTGVSGGFDLLERVTLALQDATIVTDYQLVFVDERPLAADDRVVMYGQRYEARRLAETSAPTFDGQAIGGTDSVVRVLVGSLRRSTVRFGFAGIDGIFRHDLGGRGRDIVWRGQLRAASNAALNTIEQTLEGYVSDPRAFTLVDSWGRTYTDCALDGFERRGARRNDSVTGQALQDFELTFEQLNL